MLLQRVIDIRIKGISCWLPLREEGVEALYPYFGCEDSKKISQVTGVEKRRLVDPGETTSDLCLKSAEALLTDLNWSRDEVGALIFVSQTPDFILPSTACVLHGKLGLAKSCAAFDINLGCSGWVYGLWVISTLMANGGIKKALLLAGDTISVIVSKKDRSSQPIFGDAGTTTALEREIGAPPFFFALGSDGSSYDRLIVPAGGFRERASDVTRNEAADENDNARNREQLFMDGAEIFSFSIREVPPMVKNLLDSTGLQSEQIDIFFFHQANKMMIDYLVKKMKIPKEKAPVTLGKVGNTSSASIPLGIALHNLEIGSPDWRRERVMALGFGVGLSWGAALINLQCTRILPVGCFSKEG
jgi:3-oxoacyl-[acyl-carrier-protein] synthase III